MPRSSWTGDKTYAAVQQDLTERCLAKDGSLFTPEQAVWTLEFAQALDGRVGDYDSSDDSFIIKLQRQIDGLEPAAIQLAAELLYVEQLGEGDTGGPKKEENLGNALKVLDDPPAIPEELLAALNQKGVASYGAGKTGRDAYMRFLVRFLIAWKSLPEEEQQARLKDPWQFQQVVISARTSRDALPANALLHLLYPETFDYMIGPKDREKLLKAFAHAPGVSDIAETEEEGGIDRKILVIRKDAREALGQEMELYDQPAKRIWHDPAPAVWEQALDWATRLYGWPDFDKEERDYKLKLAKKVGAARDALASDSADWLEQLRKAFTDKNNNLTAWRNHDGFLDWCRDNSDQAKPLISALWTADDPQAGLRQFLRDLPREAASGPGSRLSIASYLLLGVDAEHIPYFKWTIYTGFRKVLDLPSQGHVDLDPDATYRPEDVASMIGVDGRRVRDYLRETYPREDQEKGTDWSLTGEEVQDIVDHFNEDDADTTAATYRDWFELLEELLLRLLGRGVALRDLLDAQGIAYWLSTGGAPADWSEEDKQAFESFCQGTVTTPTPPTTDPDQPPLPAATPALAEPLYVPQDWLQKIIGLLNEKQQVIFYGPPGTGKTYIAQALGEHLIRGGGEVRLVQFHPSYTYEDFFEGYRPDDPEGQEMRFKLVPGVLRQLVKDARDAPDKPHVLIVDEINRGNVAKIFGELYFLLEYRDKAIELQYSRNEPLALPKNLFLIGTMNTADRSIALVDSALRRRFYFVPFLPTEAPIKDVLSKWLERHELDPEPAVLLAALNKSIGKEADDEFGVGPSYFMTADGSNPDLDTVWEYSIKPLLVEHYYGEGRDIENEFGPKALADQVASEADSTTAEPEPAKVDGAGS
jgi:hypothetical protein